jgi:hypothetical protein
MGEIEVQILRVAGGRAKGSAVVAASVTSLRMRGRSAMVGKDLKGTKDWSAGCAAALAEGSGEREDEVGH